MLKSALRYLLALFMILVGALHFKDAEIFASIVPNYLPYPMQLVYISGVFEILGGIGLLVPKVAPCAAWGLIALYIAVFPANIHMAIHNIPIRGQTFPILNWVRLPIQLVFIAWAYWYTSSKSCTKRK